MSQRITIEIKDKIATCLTELPVVCGNADYVVDFAFDEEWNEHEVKTAIFVVNGKATPQVFAGNVCPIPVIQNTLIVWVGVFAGTVDDGTLSTSTPALVKCIPCITDGDNVPMAPPDDVYNQIIALIEAGMLKGEQGEKGEKGDKGDAGAIKFMAVTSLPTENIATDAIYLLPMPDGTGDNTFAEYVYIDGKWEVLGSVALNVDHSEYVKFTDYATTRRAGVIKWTGTNYGIYIDGVNGNISLAQPSNTDIDNRNANNDTVKAITLKILDYAFKMAATTNTETWTDEEKASACETIGAVKKPATGAENGSFNVVMPNGTIRQVNLAYSNYPSINAIPVFNTNKTIMVNDAVADTDAPNWGQVKKYVDDLIAELRAMIES